MPGIPPASGRVAVFQPLPGIGDTVWHVPHLHALASTAPDGRLSLITKPRSAADRLLAGDDVVESVIWLDRNPEGRRGRHDGIGGLARLIGDLRAGGFTRLYILHHSPRYAMAARLAGIAERYGYGYGLQRRLLSGPPWLPEDLRTAHPIDEATAFLRLLGLTLEDSEPSLSPTPEAVRTVAARHGHLPRPWLALGLGSSESYKQWGGERYATLARGLADGGWPTLLLVGGPAEAGMAPAIAAALGEHAGRAVPVFDRPLEEVVALLAECALYVGNDTGVLNIAAAVGVPAVGLFGATEPLRHSRRIVPLLPPGGLPVRPDGMAAITVDRVLQAVEALAPRATGGGLDGDRLSAGRRPGRRRAR